MRFREVQHQAAALALIRRTLRSQRVPHAYLFAGPEGVGKELTARALAARLLCQSPELPPDADACDACSSCRLLRADNHPDFHLVHRGLHKLHPDRAVRARKGLVLSVDLIRHFLIDPAATTPSQGIRRVFVVRDAERMNEEAQNALLKTLEEPPGSAVLILVTAAASRLRETIRSRCQQVTFGLLPAAFVSGRLMAHEGVARADAEALAALSDGRLGAALRWHRLRLLEMAGPISAALAGDLTTNPEAFGKVLVDAAAVLAARATGPQDADAADEEAEDDEEAGEGSGGRTRSVPPHEFRDALRLVFLLIAGVYRDALLAAVEADARLLRMPNQGEVVRKLVGRSSVAGLETAIQAVAEAETMLERNVNPALVCERLAIALAGELPVG